MFSWSPGRSAELGGGRGLVASRGWTCLGCPAPRYGTVAQRHWPTIPVWSLWPLLFVGRLHAGRDQTSGVTSGNLHSPLIRVCWLAFIGAQLLHAWHFHLRLSMVTLLALASGEAGPVELPRVGKAKACSVKCERLEHMLELFLARISNTIPCTILSASCHVHFCVLLSRPPVLHAGKQCCLLTLRGLQVMTACYQQILINDCVTHSLICD